MIIPIIILAIAPQDHILGTDEINVQVSKLKLYLNILYKQEREQIFSNIQGPLVQQKAETLYLWKGKNKNYLNVWRVKTWFCLTFEEFCLKAGKFSLRSHFPNCCHFFHFYFDFFFISVYYSPNCTSQMRQAH